jgi:acyl-coenzyme A synthetase/AMP-(fatty) acid ligase
MDNFTEILTQQANKQPDAIAIVKEDEHISYQQLEKLAWQCATYLYQQGIREGDVVIHMLEDELLIVIAMLANAKIGATMLAVQKTVPKAFLDKTIDEVNAKFILSNNQINIQNYLQVISLKKELFDEIKIDKSVYIDNPKAPWQIVIGSGSSGKRKLIVKNHYKYINRLTLTKNWLLADIHTRVASFTPLEYISSKALFFETLERGATFVVLPKNITSIELVKKYKITILHSTVFHIERLLNNIKNNINMYNTQLLSNLKMLIIGGSRVSDDLRKRIKSKLTNNLYVRYGINECGTVSVTSLDKVFTVSETVGSPIKGLEVEIVDNDNNLKVKNEIGLIRIKILNIVDGYLNDEKATKKAFKDGWFYPGDIGKFTEDGQLIHLGRADDMMIMNGINIYPSQIENVMLEHPDVEEAYAFALKHKIIQDIPVCAVVLTKTSSTTNKELMQYAYKNLSSYKPQFIAILGETPRNQQGKVVKQDLIKLVLQKFQKNQIAKKSS